MYAPCVYMLFFEVLKGLGSQELELQVVKISYMNTRTQTQVFHESNQHWVTEPFLHQWKTLSSVLCVSHLARWSHLIFLLDRFILGFFFLQEIGCESFWICLAASTRNAWVKITKMITVVWENKMSSRKGSGGEISSGLVLPSHGCLLIMSPLMSLGWLFIARKPTLIHALLLAGERETWLESNFFELQHLSNPEPTPVP